MKKVIRIIVPIILVIGYVYLYYSVSHDTLQSALIIGGVLLLIFGLMIGLGNLESKDQLPPVQAGNPNVPQRLNVFMKTGNFLKQSRHLVFNEASIWLIGVALSLILYGFLFYWRVI